MDLRELAAGKTVLVWRSLQTHSSEKFGDGPCPMCATLLVNEAESYEYEGSWGPGTGGPGVTLTETSRCPLCGWTYAWEQDTHGYYNTPLTQASTSVLRNLDLNSDDLRLVELGTHLSTHSERLFDLSPRRFERLMSRLFSDLGFDAVHTGRAGDGGADIVLFRDSHRKTWGIVECKRYAKHRKVQPEVLRSLIGAAVDFGVRRAYLVTTGKVSGGFRVKLDDFRSKGYELELLQATEILKMLGVYSKALPSLDKLSKRIRTEIVSENLGRRS